MKKNYIVYIVLFVIIALIIIDFSCIKDNNNANNSNTSFTSNEIAQAQNAEHLDVVFDMIDNVIDNDVDIIEKYNFYPLKKSASSDCLTLNIDHHDTTTWPKMLSLTYNCLDTVLAQHINLRGKIQVTVDTIPGAGINNWRTFYSRTFSFSNFFIVSDSDTLVVIQGTRKVYRRGVNHIFYGGLLGPKEFLITHTKDSIITDSLIISENFPGGNKNIIRNVSKIGNIVIWYKNSSTSPIYKKVISRDSVICSGLVSGIDANGENYSRKITSPLIYMFCPTWPYNSIITSGSITQTINNADTILFNYSASTSCNTKVSIVKNGKSITINRKFSKKPIKWW